MTAPSNGSSRSASSCRSRDARWVTVATRPSDAAWIGQRTKPWQRSPSYGTWRSGSTPSSSPRAGLGAAVESLADRTSVDCVGRRRRGTLSAGRRGCRLLRHLRGADERHEVRPGDQGDGAGARARRSPEHRGRGRRDRWCGPAFRQRPAWSRRPTRRARRDDHGREPDRWRDARSRRRSRPINLCRTPCQPCRRLPARMARWTA